jgi:WD40 repeat protein
LYDGTTGDVIHELSKAENSHKGSIFSASWNPDSTQILSGSADMTAKIWDVAAQKVVSTYSFADKPTFDNQQVGTLWSGSFLVTASLSGDLNYIDPREPNRPKRVIKGHQRGITTLETTDDKKIYTGSYDGRICSWELGVGGSIDIQGQPHTNQVVALAKNGDSVFSVGMDDTFRSINQKTKKYTDLVFPTGSLPKDMATKGDISAIVIGEEVILMKNGAKDKSLKTKFQSTSVDISPDGKTVAVGSDAAKVYLYNVSDFQEIGVLESNRGMVTCLAYSPSGNLLAAGDSQRTIIVYDTKTKQVKIDQWVFHSAKIMSIAWSPDEKHAVSGSLDCNVEVWSVDEPMKHLTVKKAHLESITGTRFLDNETIVSVGGDASIKVFKVSY